MTEAGPPGQGPPVASSATFAARFANASRAAGAPLLFGLRLWVSVCLALYLAFWLELDNPYWAGTTAALVRLRRICRRFDLGSHLDAALAAMARGDSATTIARLARLDEALAARPGAAALRARSSILAMSEALTQHAAYFGAGPLG